MSNISIYPFLRRYPMTGKHSPDITNEEIQAISKHFISQIMQNLEHMGFDLDSTFLQDIDFTYGALNATILRMVGKHHPLQGYIDELHTDTDSNDGS